MKLFLLFLLTIFLFISKNNAQTDKADWKNLFDGKTFSGWKKLAGSAEYIIQNGAITGITVPNTPNTFLATEKEYGDFILEFDVRIEDTTSNSGVQFRSQYDPTGNKGVGKVSGYQFELDPAARRWTGGIFDEGRRGWLYPLVLNPSAHNLFKFGQFNTMRIECIGNTIQTFVNNMPAARIEDEMSNKGIIALQVHSIGNAAMAGKKIHWKNIRIKTEKIKLSKVPLNLYVVNTIPNNLSAFEKSNGWKLLFDGKTSNGWKGAYQNNFPEKGWVIKDGMLSVLSSEGKESTNGGDIVSKEKFSAFDLSFDFKLSAGANSGVKYFVTLSENNQGSAIGLEYQLLDDSLHADAQMGRDGNRTLASLYDLIKANKATRFFNQAGEWNRGRIVVYPNNHVEHYLNGIKVVEYDRGSQAFRDLVAMSKHKIWPNFGEAKEGYILLQDHGNAVSFRSIKVRKLK